MRVVLFLLCLCLVPSLSCAAERAAWTTSRLVGTPEPPPKYQTVNAYPKVHFSQPTVVTNAPNSSRLFVAERFGKIFSLADDPEVKQADPFLDLKAEHTENAGENIAGFGSIYGLTFHPEYPKKPLVYVCYTLNPKNRDEPLLAGTIVSEFEVKQTDPPTADPATERPLIHWREGGHNGGCLKFGPDGFLYITTGDAAPPNPPDPLKAGQDVGNILSALLRIDVNRSSGELPYAIPSDNPFVSLKNARGEIWSYGYRNPWKMSFDRATGELWIGDVGWELWEMVYRVQKAGNYGWSITEGPQAIHPDDPVGPTPILPPAISLPHSESSSVTGGFVYRGEKFPDLVGKYVFADYDTRGVWAAQFENGALVSRETITPPEHRVVAFAEKNDGELLLVDFESGTLNRLVPNEVEAAAHPFPRKLSETGLFANVETQEPAAGVSPFEINLSMWMDGATAQYFIALPGESSVRWYPTKQPVPGVPRRAQLFFPEGAVLVKTISLETTAGTKQIETQVLQFAGRFWNAYTYRWNEQQTDATLVPAEGAVTSFTIPDPHAPERQSDLRWTFQGRQQCLRCHNQWNEYGLAFNIPQLNLSETPQLEDLQALKLLEKVTEENGKKFAWKDDLPRLFDAKKNPFGGDENPRSYLHVNCAHCHQQHAGGTTRIDLRFDLDVDKMNLLETAPMQGAFGIEHAQLVRPGDPWRSILYYRMLVSGSGHMPHIGAERIDTDGVGTIQYWIGSLDTLYEQSSLARDFGRFDWKDADRDATVAFAKRLLSSLEGQMLLEHELRRGKLSDTQRETILDLVLAQPDVSVRKLFARWLPKSARQPTLGPIIRPEILLAVEGNATRGEELFFSEKLVQCARCHQVGKRGGNIGPKLDDVGKRLKTDELIESLLEPSRKIDPKFQTYIAITTDGKVHAGLLLSESNTAIELVNVKGDKIALSRSDLEDLQPQRSSLMPDQLLRDLTQQQAADLLAWLQGLK